jgi:hypothetical protein
MLDARILLTTLLRVLKREGVSQNGHVTMPEFLACFMRERANQGMHKSFFREDE